MLSCMNILHSDCSFFRCLFSALPLLVHHLACNFCIHVILCVCVWPPGLDWAICVALVPDGIPVAMHLKTVVPC